MYETLVGSSIRGRICNKTGEVVVKLAQGWTLRSGVSEDCHDFVAGEYVRLCNPRGKEIMYWSADEWQTDPVLVMGAIMVSAAGLLKEKKGKGNV